MYVYHKTLWEVKPAFYSQETFRLFLGDIARKPRILSDQETVAPEDEGLVMKIPVDFRPEFERDLLSAIRDIAGRPTFALNPFIVNQDAVAACFGKRAPLLTLTDCDFEKTRPQIYLDNIERPEEPRFAHVDLGLTNDSAGVAVGWISSFTKVRRGPEHAEILPVIEMDLVLGVKPPKNSEIEFENIHRLFYRLREAGVNLKWISFDSFQSRDSVQIAGVVFGLTYRRELWVRHQIPLTEIPASLIRTKDERV